MGYKHTVAESIERQLQDTLVRLEYEILATEKKIENFNLTRKPIAKSGMPNVCMIELQDNNGNKKSIQATSYLNNLKEKLEDIEVQLASIGVLLLKYKSEDKEE